MICETLIANGIEFNCGGVSRGFEADGVIINRADIDFDTSVTTGNTTTVVLKTGKTGYNVKQFGNAPFEGSEISLNVGTYVNTWTKNIQVLIPSIGENTSDLIDNLVSGDVVLILRNKQKTDLLKVGAQAAVACEYEIFGWEQGMKVSAGTRTPNDEDTLGGTLLTLTETGAASHAVYLWASTAEATKTAYESLVNA